jgi:hypothetical protein
MRTKLLDTKFGRASFVSKEGFKKLGVLKQGKSI